MSYLDVPRVSFSGRFMARPSTANNQAANYDPTVPLNPNEAEWHPRGTGEFRFIDCKVTAVTDESYDTVTTHPLVGTTIGTDDTDSSPKIVDLDPEQQNYPELFGMRMRLTNASGALLFSGRLDPPPTARDLWTRNQHAGSQPGANSTAFQSVLAGIQDTPGSEPLLATMLRLGSGRLSVKFVLDDFHLGARDANGQFVTSDPNFATGRLVGVIGPARSDEPSGFLAARRLLPTADRYFPMAPAPFVIDGTRRKLTIDLSNSTPWKATAGLRVGDAIDGVLYAATRDGSGAFTRIGPDLDCSRAAYETTASIFDRDVTEAQAAVLAAQPLYVVYAGQAADVAALAEAADGICVEGEPLVARLNGGQSVNVEVRARKFGLPLTGHAVKWEFDSSSPDGSRAVTIDTPQPLVTGADGRATVRITARRLRAVAPARRYLESEVCFLGGPWAATYLGGVAGAMGQAVPLSVLVFLDRPAIDEPRWADVQPLLHRYGRLYPGMRAILSLDHLATVKANRDRMITVLSHEFNHPNHMPVTRDLPAFQRQTLLNWLHAGCPE